MTQKRIVLITGASSGIGAALARRLSGPDTSLCLHARSNANGLEKVAEDAQQSGSPVLTGLGDLAEDQTGPQIVQTCIDTFGGLDHLVANAGFPVIKSFEDGQAEDIDYAFRSNTFSLFSMVRSALPALRKSTSGRVVAVGSFTAHSFRNDMPLFPLSAASKGAVEVAIRSLAADLAKHGVTANCVVPGYIRKDKDTKDGLDPAKLAELTANIPIGRLGEPDDVAALIDFLLGEGASYITGQSIHINGGLVI